MWITIISENFKDLLETLKTKPWVIIVLSLMFLSGLFINKWAASKDTSIDEIKASNKEINVIRDSMYHYKYEAIYYKKMYERNVEETDSLFKEYRKIVKPIVDINNKQNE